MFLPRYQTAPQVVRILWQLGHLNRSRYPLPMHQPLINKRELLDLRVNRVMGKRNNDVSVNISPRREWLMTELPSCDRHRETGIQTRRFADSSRYSDLILVHFITSSHQLRLACYVQIRQNSIKRSLLSETRTMTRQTRCYYILDVWIVNNVNIFESGDLA